MTRQKKLTLFLGLMIGFIQIFWCGDSFSTLAQAPQPTAHFSTPQTDQFPLVQILMDIHDPKGGFVHGLGKDNLQLLENGQPVNLQDFHEEHLGVQLVFVINPGDSFLQSDQEGNTYYDLLISNLVEWARKKLGSTLDDLSIIVTDGPSQSHLNNPLELFYTLASYNLPSNPSPSLDSALKAIDIAADPPPRPGMKRLVLLITAPLSDDQVVSLQNLQARANQNQVHFHIWLVTSPNELASPNAPLTQLAEQTQGSITSIRKPQDIPDLEALLSPLRYSYALSYSSQITNAGEQQVSAEIHTKEFNIQVPSISYKLDLKPPNPAFISPPTEIIRKPNDATTGASFKSQSGDLFPSQQKLNLIIDFPDGRQRQIVLTRFWVDGTIINEIKQPPYDQITWDLTKYQQSGHHILQVEVIDQLGLSGKTIETPIYVKVEHPAQSSSKFLPQNIIWIAISIILFSAALFLLALIMGGRLSPVSQRMSKRLSSPRKTSQDPLSQPVPIHPLPLHSQVIKPNLTVSNNPFPQNFGRLIPLASSKTDVTPGQYDLTSDEVGIGKRADAVQFVINDPSVDAIHAKLVRLEDGRYRLLDNGSLYGTWVNYTPISQEGIILEDGDLIHFGKVGFRFSIS